MVLISENLYSFTQEIMLSSRTHFDVPWFHRHIARNSVVPDHLQRPGSKIESNVSRRAREKQGAARW